MEEMGLSAASPKETTLRRQLFRPSLKVRVELYRCRREGDPGRGRGSGKTSRQPHAWCWRNSEGPDRVTEGTVVAKMFREITGVGAGGPGCGGPYRSL